MVDFGVELVSYGARIAKVFSDSRDVTLFLGTCFEQVAGWATQRYLRNTK